MHNFKFRPILDDDEDIPAPASKAYVSKAPVDKDPAPKPAGNRVQTREVSMNKVSMNKQAEPSHAVSPSADNKPAWRKAFALSANVRFTRTPDIEILKKQAEKNPIIAQELQALENNRLSARQHALQQQQQVLEKHSLPIETHKPESVGSQDPIAATQTPNTQESSKQDAAQNYANLSDFVFFAADLASFDIPAPKSSAHTYETTADISKEKLDSAPQAPIENMFRVLEWSFQNNTDQKPLDTEHKITEHDDADAQLDVDNTQPVDVADAQTINEASLYDDLSDADALLNETPDEDNSYVALDNDQTHDQNECEADDFANPEICDQMDDLQEASLAQPLADQEQACIETVADDVETQSINDLPQEEINQKADDPIDDLHARQAVESSRIVETAHRQAKPQAALQTMVTSPAKPLPRQNTNFDYQFPDITCLQEPVYEDGAVISQESLERSAGLLESILEDFGIKGEIIHVHPGPVVTLYEFEPAPGIKSSRIIGLSDDIARSMSAISARVAVIPGRNAIGIELPNKVRETVYLRELIDNPAFQDSRYKLALALGKTIGGAPVVAELAKMPHLLVAGTTGSGKSVAINTMILSLLYRLKPEQCRLIMVDPKMLELSIYDGIPHLLTPVVTDPKKAVTALKWAVREMEERYRKMAKLGVRNIDGFNQRIQLARENNETIMCTVQAGFDKTTGELLYRDEAMDLTSMPYIVIVVDEMADLMMVAGKEIESAIQRLAQMARAAGIHLIMATQRPSVDVITGTIKANFPTRISFSVTSKIDSRTILGEQGAEALLGLGDMLKMAGGGRIERIHGPFVSDGEVERIVSHLKTQGTPDYLSTVTDEPEDSSEENDLSAIVEMVNNSTSEDGEELYLQAVKIVMRDKKCSTSYIQRRLSIGYNKAASLVERMEDEGLVGPANHVGKREILLMNKSIDGE